MDDRLRSAPLGVLEVVDGVVAAADDRAAALLDADPGTLTGTDACEALPRSTAGTVHDALAGSPEGCSVEEYYPEIDRWLAVDVVPGGEDEETAGSGDHDDGTGTGSTLVYLRDREPRHERRQRIERLERRLDRMEAIDDLVVAVLRRMIDADERADVFRTVSERLGGTDGYGFAWVGERDLADGRLRIVTAAGDAPDLRDRIETALADDEPLPERTAVEAGATETVGTIADEGALPRPVRTAAFGRGLRAALAVPLVHRGTVHGVLGVYTAREAGFSDGERASLETLGAVAGFAITAIRQEDLLFADTVTELTVEVRDPDSPLAAGARAADGRLALAGAVPREDDAVVCYLAPDGAPGAVVDALADRADVASARRVGEGDDDADTPDGDALLEVEVTGETPLTTLAARGATVQEATYEGTTATITADVPSDADLRRLVGAVDGTVEETDVLAKRERDRDPRTADAFRSDLEDRLTDRQRRVLRTAYLSDYFASPRGSSAEQVAEALDVTGPTVLYHLRRAQRKLLDTFFRADPDSDPAVPRDR